MKVKSQRRHVIKASLGFLISILCFLGVVRIVDISNLLAVLKSADLSLVFVAVATMFVSYLIRAARWPFFFSHHSPSFYTSFRCMIIGFFMNNLLPARMGELVRAHVGGRATNQSRALVLATVAGERLIDGLTISLFFALMFTFSKSALDLKLTHQAYLLSGEMSALVGSMAVPTSPELFDSFYYFNKYSASAFDIRYGQLIFYVAYLFLFAGIGTIFIIIVRNQVFEILNRLSNLMPGHLSGYTLQRARVFIEGLEPMLRLVKLCNITFLSVIVWGIELSVFYLISLAFHEPLSLGALSLFLAVVNFSSLIPAAPGGIGVIELLATMALSGIGINPEKAFAMVLTQHAIQLLVVGVPGAYFFFSMLGGKVPDADEEPDIDVEEVSEKFSCVDVSAGSKDSDKLVIGSDDSSQCEISVVIPAYNEEDRLPKTLLSIVEYLKENYSSYEVLVVNDGSSDGTSDVVNKISSLAKEVVLLEYDKNMGKGYAVRYGMMKARGRLILMNDADGASPISELARLHIAIDNGAHIVIGSRAAYSSDTEVETIWYRRLMGRVFNGLVNLLILPGIADTQCGFKLFLNPVAKKIFAKQKNDGFSFDVEILFLARSMGCKIAEVPINWTNISGSRINLVSDSFCMFKDVLVLKGRSLFGVYGKK